MSTIINIPRGFKFYGAVLTLAALAVGLLAAARPASPAHAQFVDDSPPPLADLSIAAEYLNERQLAWDIVVKNNTVGGRPGVTARLVRVRIVRTHSDGTETAEVRIIRDLRPGLQSIIAVSPSRPPPTTAGPALAPLWLYAEIIETDPVEPPGFQFNNTTEHWGMADRRAGREFRSNGDVSVGIQISDRFPQAGGATTFTVNATNFPGPAQGLLADNDDTQLDVEVEIRLSPGLTFASTPQAPAGTTFDPATGTWAIGTLVSSRQRDNSYSLPVSVNLTADSLADLPREERCLTAEVTKALPWPAKRENDIATACLGEDPKVLLTNDDIPLLFMDDCVGDSVYPCTDADTLELVVYVNRRYINLPGLGRVDSGTIGNGLTYLQPETVIVHVHEPGGRHDGKWRTGTTTRHQSYVVDIPGVGIIFEYVKGSAWTQITRAIRDVSPKQRPGSLSILGGPTATFAMLDADTMPSRTPSNLSASFRSNPYPVFLIFGTLGLYKVNVNFGATKSGTAYTGSGVYTFYVGPISELEVRDAKDNPAAAGHRPAAYTVAAVNNGPNWASAAQVTLTGVPEGAEAIASEGSYTEGACENGLCEGVWAIGKLDISDIRRASGRAEESTLVLITDDVNAAPITASIANTQDYAVCIDSSGDDVAAYSRSACEATSGNSWHSTEYYDHIEKNNAATIAARAGTGQGHPDAPRSLRVDEFGSLALLRWQAVERVNRFDVTHYHVERNGVMLADNVGGIMYADLQGGAVNQSYRVRAVNELGVTGPWSLPAGAGGPLEQPGELAAPAGLTASVGLGGDRIDLSWFAPSEESGLRYRIEHATDGAGPWRTLQNSYSGTTYSHPGLRPGTTYFYRVAAVKGNVISPWAYVQATTGVPDIFVPGWPMNLRFTSVDRTAVTLAWDPPVDDGGSRITGYEYRVDGPCASGSGICDIAAPTRVSGTSRRISLPNRAGTYQFQVRALNAAGAGDWSQPIEKEVDPQNTRSGRMVLSPSRLTVREGGEATYRVRLSTNPTTPLWLSLHWEGDEDLADELRYQQSLALLPTGYDTSGLPATCNAFRYGYDWESKSYAWNVGIPITVVAAEDEDTVNGRLTITHDLWTPPADCLGMTADEWSPDPVYDGMMMIGLTVTERDTGSNSPTGNAVGPTGNTGAQQGSPGARQGSPGDPQSSPGAAGQPTAVTLALDPATVGENAREVTVTATLDAPAPDGGVSFRLVPGPDDTAVRDADYTMPDSIAVAAGERSGTGVIAVVDDHLDEFGEAAYIVAFAALDYGDLTGKAVLTILDDDTAGVTVSAANPLEMDEDGTATYTVVLDSQPTAAVTITASSDDVGAATVSPASHTFQPSGWNTPLTFTVSGVADADTSDETVAISHGVTSADAKYAVLPVAMVVVAVTDTTPPGQ